MRAAVTPAAHYRAPFAAQSAAARNTEAMRRNGMPPRRLTRGMWAQKGSLHRHARLTELEVESIRLERLRGDLLTEVASRHRISVSHTCNIVKGRKWAHVPMPE